MKILGKNRAFSIISARRKAREANNPGNGRNKIDEYFLKEAPKKQKNQKNAPVVPGLANTTFTPKNKVNSTSGAKQEGYALTQMDLYDSTSAEKRVRNKVATNSLSTPSSKGTPPKKPRHGSNKAANRRYEKQMRDYKRKNNPSESRQDKRKTDLMVTRAKGVSATTLGDYTRANELRRKASNIQSRIDKKNKKLAKRGIYQTQPGTYNFGAAGMFEKFRPKGK